MGGDTAGSDHGRRSRRWKRTGAIGGLVTAVLLVVTLLLLASLPSPGSSDPAIVAQLRASHAVALAASYTGVLTRVAMIPFVASFRAFTQVPDGESQ